ncbi:MAG: DUF4301 family protein [Prevotellaceae bacterium]|nr:DUF4301 family protein [Prevotellaceae bacterium]MDY6130690.1 DUF4301 family protein [Prevotella sp.]
MLLSQQDRDQMGRKGITENNILAQLEDFRTGFPFLKIEAAAGINHGIMVPEESERKQLIERWNEYKAQGKKIVKFVPASGAASRMFKDMFAFLSADADVPSTEFEKTFFNSMERFAFYDALDAECRKNEGRGISQLLANGNYKAVVANMLEEKGLGYGRLPKGMLLFHSYPEGARTPMEEHLVEGALYAGSRGEVNVHFTVSHEHLAYFEQKVAEKRDQLEQKYGMKYNISFSVQKPSTDTIAVNPDNTLFRNEDGTLLFRPGGHGALIQNLNDIDADIIFIKNIDNVIPDRLKAETVEYKQLLAGVLVTLQKQAFKYLEMMENEKYNRLQINDIADFVEQKLFCKKQDLELLSDEQLATYLKKKLNRPMRVCGVVKNVGEPGGGPFLVHNTDGTVSLQILESSQIDKNNKEYLKMFAEGTHFNPVDLVCATKDYKGNTFNLPDFIDKSTGFISSKSKNGKELKALELPGLWNGAMSRWNTVFVEVPLSTFNPVKTVNDLLREQHQ